MSAKAIIPGRLYRVHGAGTDMDILAPHGSVAICHALAVAFPEITGDNA